MLFLRWMIPLTVLLTIGSYLFEAETPQADPLPSALARIQSKSDEMDSLPKPGMGQSLPKPGLHSTDATTHQWNQPKRHERDTFTSPTDTPPIRPKESPQQLTQVESFETALTSTTEYYSQFLTSYREPAFKRYSGRIETLCTGDEHTHSDFAFYCPVNQTIYFNQAFIDEMPHPEGLYEVVAHEVAHHVQHLTGTHHGHATPAHTKASEHEADCLAGAWMGWVMAHGNEPVSNWMELTHSKWTHYGWREQLRGQPSETHGAVRDRQALFTRGVTGGMDACAPDFSRYFNTTP